MNTKIGTSFGLALLLAVGVIATMLVLGTFSAQKANAGAPVVTALSASPSEPGDSASVKVTFTTDEKIEGNSGEIWVRFDKNYTVPSTIDKELITITSVQTTGGTSNPLIDPTIETVTSSTDANLLSDNIVKITLGDTVPSSTGSVEDLHAAAGHIITFASSAGIKLPTGSSTTANIIRMSNNGSTTYGTEVLDIDTSRILTLSATSGAKGAVVTATGKGFSSTGTATLWIDDGDGSGTADDGIINGTETTIASGIAVTDGSFTYDFTTDTNYSVGSNEINAIDAGGTSVGTSSNPTFSITGGVTLGSTTVARGGTLKVTLAQYGNGTVTAVKFGGVESNLGSLTAGSTAVASNAGTLTVTVPSTTPLGTQQVAVVSTGEDTRTATVEVTVVWAGVTITPTPATAVPLQEITVSASGFTGSSTVATITVGGSSVTTLASGSAVTTVATDNSGNLVASFDIPNDATTRTAKTYQIRITDAAGKVGEADLVIPALTFALDTASSKRSSTVTASGTGYPAESTITIDYAGTTVATTTADSAGAFSTTYLVPSSAGIPSTNTVTATSGSGGGNKTATHKVPGSTISIDPTTASSGSSITVTGINFPGYVSVTKMDIGGIAAITSPAPATDSDGEFSQAIVVPQLTVGTHSVVITAGGISANTSLIVEAASAVVVATSTATADVFADVTADDNLVRVWRFSNADQEWSFYDPRDAFAAANTLTDTASGDIVWVNVTAAQAFQSTTLVAGWNLISLD